MSYETVLNFIRTTRTETGLTCQAYLDQLEISLIPPQPLKHPMLTGTPFPFYVVDAIFPRK